MTKLRRAFFDGERKWPAGTEVSTIPYFRDHPLPKSAEDAVFARGYAEQDAKARMDKVYAGRLSVPVADETPTTLSAALPKGAVGEPSTLSEATAAKVAKR